MKPAVIEVALPKYHDPENTTDEEYEEVIALYKEIIYSMYGNQQQEEY